MKRDVRVVVLLVFREAVVVLKYSMPWAVNNGSIILVKDSVSPCRTMIRLLRRVCFRVREFNVLCRLLDLSPGTLSMKTPQLLLWVVRPTFAPETEVGTNNNLLHTIGTKDPETISRYPMGCDFVPRCLRRWLGSHSNMPSLQIMQHGVVAVALFILIDIAPSTWGL